MNRIELDRFKPHITYYPPLVDGDLVLADGHWSCAADKGNGYFEWGDGDSPKEAYEAWALH